MKYLYLLLCLAAFTYTAFGQEKITGTVVSREDLGPLPGAQVLVRGSRAIIVCSADGSFSFRSSRALDTLEVSCLGFQLEVVPLLIPPGKPLVISLAPARNGLKEVQVSTGYQQVAKERATGSFDQVSNSLFNQQVSTDVLSRLEAVASGLSVERNTASPGIMVRGLSTIQGLTGPLIVLDNFPYDGDVNQINPNDVESITVLKDAAAASIWGAMAGNGVIVITTKKGKYNQPLAVDFTADVSAGPKPNLDYFKTMSSSDYIGVEKMLFGQGFYDSQISDPSHPALSPAVEILLAERNGALTATAANAQLNYLSGLDSRKQFEQYIYQPLLNQQYALDLHGGSDKYSWLASGGYDDNSANLDAKYNRLSLHYQNTVRPVKGLELSTGLWFTQTHTRSGKIGYGDPGYGNYPYLQLADANGNPLPIARDYSLSYLATLAGDGLEDWKYYPLEDYKQDVTTGSEQDMTADAGVSYELLRGLKLDIKYRYERDENNTLDNHGADSYYSRSLVNDYTQMSAPGELTYEIPQGGIEDFSNTTLVSQDGRGQLTYNKDWAKGSVSAIGGAEIRDALTTGYTFREYGVNSENLSTGTVDYNDPFQTFVNGYYNYVPYVDGLEGLDNRFVSVFSNVAYTYDNRYILSMSGRRDASNLYGVSTDNKWTPLWSAGAAWNVSNESFYHSGLLPYLKLRATYGYAGNTDPNRTGVTTISIFGNSVYSGSPYGRIEQYADPDLRWERVGMLNFGLDFRSKDSRITGSVEYYRKNADDLFGPALVDYTTGIGATAVRNVASMIGHGVDVELNSVNTRGAVRWTTNLLLSTYHDEITSYYEPSTIGSNFVGAAGLSTISGLPGKPVYSILSYRWAGLDPQTGDPRGFLNGQVSKDYADILGSGTSVSDLVYSGPALPTVFGSLGNSVAWGHISLTVRLLYKFGYYFRRPAMDYSDLFNGGVGNADFSKRWQKPGDELSTNVPSMIYPDYPNRDQFYTGSSVNVDKGDNIRVQYLNLVYTLDRGQLQSLPFKSLDVYVAASNLGIIWRANKDGLDPDYPAGTLPPVKIFALGVKGSF
jgi:TonB-linked SusC/RagA family outer membrane protein